MEPLSVAEFLRLLAGTVMLRPYVFAFLAVYVLAASAHIGLRKALVFIPVGYSIAWLSEFSSIHWGFPYGDYYYIHDTLDMELWVLGVPFMDSLSYVFLSYCSYSMAVFLLSPVLFTWKNVLILETRAIRRSPQTLALGACLFVLLDIIIDPVAHLGDRWFLGKIYGYANPGLYFGIPISNFGGWLLVGLISIWVIQQLDSLPLLENKNSSFCSTLNSIPSVGLLGPVLYISVLAFNMTVTIWIGELFLALVGCLILAFPLILGILFSCFKHRHLSRTQISAHLVDFPAFNSSREEFLQEVASAKR